MTTIRKGRLGVAISGLVAAMLLGMAVDAQNKGDINDDGRIDAGDFLLLAKDRNGQRALQPEEVSAADVSPLNGGVSPGDGTIDISDLLALGRGLVGDADSDALTLAGETQAGTSPFLRDTDGDGLPDGTEVANGLDPTDPSSGNTPPNAPVLTVIEQLATEVTGSTDPCVDPDGLPDGACQVRVVAVAQGAPCDAPPVGRSIQAGQSWSVRDLDLLTSYTFHAIASDGLHETCSTLGVDAATSTSPLHFVISGDTQTLSTSDQKLALWMGQYQNLCEQTPRIQHVIHTGDVINLGDDPGNSQIPVQYARAAQAFDVLDACGIGYSIPAGNHDYVYAPPSEIDDQDYLDFINGRPPSHWRDVVVGANTPFYIKRLFDRYYLVVLRFRYADSDDAAIEAYVQANPDKRFMVVHHSGAKRVDAPVDFDLLAGLIDRNPNIIGMISGHWLGWPRTGYGTNTSLPRTDWLRVYSNFQDSEPGYPWPAFAQWMTRMTYYPATREFCFRSEDPIAGSFDIAGPEFCWYDPT